MGSAPMDGLGSEWLGREGWVSRVAELRDGLGSCNRVFRFRLFRFSVCFLFGQTVRLAGAKSSHHLHYNCVVLSLFGKNKKHISKMTWQLTAKFN